jgi:uncharacterized membrane protein YhhN
MLSEPWSRPARTRARLLVLLAGISWLPHLVALEWGGLVKFACCALIAVSVLPLAASRQEQFRLTCRIAAGVNFGALLLVAGPYMIVAAPFFLLFCPAPALLLTATWRNVGRLPPAVYCAYAAVPFVAVLAG